MLIRLLLLLAAAVAEAVPLALSAGMVAAWIMPNGTAAVSAVSLIGVVLLGFALTRALMKRRLGQRRARLVLAAVALAVALPLYLGARVLNPVAVRDPLLAPALAALLYAWSRGAVLARDELVFDIIYVSFRRGLILLFVVLLVALNTPGAAAHRLVGGGWGSVATFFLSALCALSLARVEEERRRGAGPEGPPPVRGEWVVTLLGVTGAVLLVGLALATFVSPAALSLALAPLGRVADLLLWLLTPLILFLATVVDALVHWLRPLIHPRPMSPPGAPGHGKPVLPPHHHLLTTAQAQALAHILLAVVALFLACLTVWYAFSYRRRGDADVDGDEERESLWSWALLRAGLRALLGRLWTRLVGRRAVEGLAAHLAGDEESGVRSIREAYRRLLARAATLGLPRRSNETPHEYLARLRGAVPAGEKDAALLTGMYARARYGPGTPQPREVAAAAEVWARLDAALRQKEGDVSSP